MDSQYKNVELKSSNLLEEHLPDYEKAETDLLRAALKRTHMERFLFATHLYKIQQTLRKATITHQPYQPPKSK